MEKAIIILVIILWLFMGFLGGGLADGYFNGKYPNQRYPENIEVYIDDIYLWWAKRALGSLVGPIHLMASVLWLGNNKNRWKYPIQWHYRSDLTSQERRL